MLNFIFRIKILFLLFVSFNLFSLDLSKYTLKNGLEVYLSTNKRAPVCAYSITYKVGSSCEKKGITGISHMLEHLMFKQLDGYKIGDIDKKISRIGGVAFNANTGRDYTNYLVEVPCKNLKTVLQIDKDRLTKLRITQESLDMEKKVVLSERRMRLDNSSFGKMLFYLYKSILSGTTYSHPVIGRVRDIKNYKVDKILNYYNNHYTVNNAVVVVVGGNSKSVILKDIKDTLGTVKNNGKAICNGVPLKSYPKKVKFVKTDTSTDRIVLSYKMIIDNLRDKFLLSVLMDIFTGYSSPILKRFFDDKGLGGAGFYSDILKQNIALINFYAVSFNKKNNYKEMLFQFDEAINYLKLNLEKELKRVYKIQKLFFYESFENNADTRDFILDSVLNYGDFSVLESFYKQDFNALYLDMKKFVDKVLDNKSKFIVISRGVK